MNLWYIPFLFNSSCASASYPCHGNLPYRRAGRKNKYIQIKISATSVLRDISEVPTCIFRYPPTCYLESSC